MSDRAELSPQAQRLAELVFDGKQPMSEVLTNNPDLMTGVDEYMKWYGDHMTAISTKSEKLDTGHSVKSAVKKIKTK